MQRCRFCSSLTVKLREIIKTKKDPLAHQLSTVFMIFRRIHHHQWTLSVRFLLICILPLNFPDPYLGISLYTTNGSHTKRPWSLPFRLSRSPFLGLDLLRCSLHIPLFYHQIKWRHFQCGPRLYNVYEREWNWRVLSRDWEFGAVGHCCEVGVWV